MERWYRFGSGYQSHSQLGWSEKAPPGWWCGRYLNTIKLELVLKQIKPFPFDCELSVCRLHLDWSRGIDRTISRVIDALLSPDNQLQSIGLAE